jgi:hypothetical protein
LSRYPDPSLIDLLEPPAGIPAGIAADFERLALEVAARGFRRYSARAIAHRLRWHHHIEKGNREFAINNNWTAGLARWFHARHPDLSSFFETRARQFDSGDA